MAFRSEKDTAFRSTADSPIPPANRAAFNGLAYYPFDAKYRVPARLIADPSREALVISLQTSSSAPRQMRRVGRLEFTLLDLMYTLTAFSDVDDRAMARLFVPFTDLTSGADTYKGGRYIDLTRTQTGSTTSTSIAPTTRSASTIRRSSAPFRLARTSSRRRSAPANA